MEGRKEGGKDGSSGNCAKRKKGEYLLRQVDHIDQFSTVGRDDGIFGLGSRKPESIHCYRRRWAHPQQAVADRLVVTSIEIGLQNRLDEHWHLHAEVSIALKFIDKKAMREKQGQKEWAEREAASLRQ